MVYLKLHPYKQKSVAQRKNQKLAPRFYGPFLVLKKVGAVACELQLPASANVHPVFHVSLLKKAVGDQSIVSTQLPDLDG
ncbi:hypothetical protein LINGRAHAP2_LOCUS15178 [Linum grandiflorum]